MLIIPPSIEIPESEFELSYVRSSGPGGQNVNKVNSKAVLRWNLYASLSISLELMKRLEIRLAHKLTRDGDIIVSSDSYRDQLRNRNDCFEKFRTLIAAASAQPKKRKKTKPSRSSVRKAKENKSRHSEKKKFRKRTHTDD